MQFRPMADEDRQALQIVGHAVRIARGRAAMSQRELAARAGVSQTAISRMERGLVWGMGVIYFARVARVLGDTLTLGGCPHGHRCDFNRQWLETLRHVSPEFEVAPRYRSIMGPTLFELLRRVEADPDEALPDDPTLPPPGSDDQLLV